MFFRRTRSTAVRSAVKRIDPQELRELMRREREADYVVVDVREPDEYAQGHIPGARLMPLSQLPRHADELRGLSERKLVLYCRSGGRSSRAAQWAAQAIDHPAVHDLSGGFMGWNGQYLTRFPKLRAVEMASTPAELLRQAMDLEKGVHGLYEALAASSSPVARFFGALVEDEVDHGEVVHRLLRKVEPGAPDFESLWEQLPGEVLESGESLDEALELARQTQEWPVAVLELSLLLELSAYDLYRNLAESTSDAELRETALQLAELEKRHVHAVSRRLGEVARSGWALPEESSLHIETFFDERTYTLTYVVHDPETQDAVIIDPVLDFEPVGARIWTESVDRVLQYLQDQQLKLRLVLETHAHADHLSGAQRIKEACPSVKVGIGARITETQRTFKTLFDLPEDFATDGSQFDLLLEDGQAIQAGSLKIETMHTPGHTPACATYRIGDALFTGDALFMPDSGTGRCDFPGGSAEDIYESITERIYAQPDQTRVFVGHDYQPSGRELRFQTTVGEQKAHNYALNVNTSREDFLAFRTQRDSELRAPRLLFQSVQVNVAAGHLPENGQGQVFLKIPVNVFKPEVAIERLTLDNCEAVA